MNMLQGLRAIHKTPVSTKTKGKAPRKFTDEDKVRAEKLVIQFGYREAAKRANIPESTLARWFSKVTTLAYRVRDIRREQITDDLRNDDLTIKQLKDKYRVSQATISSDLKVIGKKVNLIMIRNGRVVTYKVKCE